VRAVYAYDGLYNGLDKDDTEDNVRYNDNMGDTDDIDLGMMHYCLGVIEIAGGSFSRFWVNFGDVPLTGVCY